MTPRRRLLFAMTAVGGAAMLFWSLLGVNASAAGKPIFIHRVAHGFFHEEPSKPVFILTLGSDQGSPRYKRMGAIDRGLADSIHIIAINPQTRSGTIVGIPRDTWVSDAGFTGKINGAMADGGPDKMVRIIEDLSGVKFDYYIVTSFQGFEDALNEIGGIVIDVPYNMHDHYSNADFHKGIQVLGGFQALAFARNRHDTPNGDFSRQENQGLVMLGGLRKARAELFNNPGALLHYLSVLYKYVATDIPIGEAFNLGMLASLVQMNDVTNVVASGYPAMAGGASIVRLDSHALTMMRDVADDALINGSASG